MLGMTPTPEAVSPSTLKVAKSGLGKFTCWMVNLSLMLGSEMPKKSVVPVSNPCVTVLLLKSILIVWRDFMPANGSGARMAVSITKESTIGSRIANEAGHLVALGSAATPVEAHAQRRTHKSSNGKAKRMAFAPKEAATKPLAKNRAPNFSSSFIRSCFDVKAGLYFCRA